MRTPTGSYPGKRLVDLSLLALSAPPCLLLGVGCAIAIKLTSPGPVFFRQERVGRSGVPFTMWKFRTMVNRPDNPMYPDADRITSTGRWLRRFSLDELPQLINVALGTMSIVGPRPTMSYQVDRYDERQRGRLLVRPGLTGLAQIRGRNAVAWSERIEHDLEYIERQSARLDLQIVGLTVRAVFLSAGVEGHPTDDPIARPEVDPRASS